MEKEDLMSQLYEKCAAEQAEYVARLESLAPKKIIDSAYEKVMRDDILMIFEEADNFTVQQTRALLKLQYPLAECYHKWLKNDCSHMEMLRDTISDFSKMLVKENQQKGQLQHKRKEKSDECR